MTPHQTRSARRWIATISIWSAFALVDASQELFTMRAEGMHHPWPRLFLTTVLDWMPWALATPFVLRLAHRLDTRRVTTWLAHLAACLSIGFVFSAWTIWLEFRLNPWGKLPGGSYNHLVVHRFFGELFFFALLYAIILIVSSVLESRARLAQEQAETARLNEQLTKTQLHALRQQIEPHFLFNTLNAVSGLVREGRDEAALTMIAGLSDFLRHMLNESTRQQVPLEQELAFTQTYLDIQKVRFADRLQLTIDIPADLYTAQVPTLILQPMVENAIKHGIAKLAHGGLIHIVASAHNGTLTLSVSNDGPSLLTNWQSAATGIGITNTTARLRSLYGDNFSLHLRNRTGGVEASVTLPIAEA